MADTASSGSGYSQGYGKRPLWQWILLYVVIGGLIYAAIYYFYLSKKGGYSYPTMMEASPSTEAMMESPTASPVASTTPGSSTAPAAATAPTVATLTMTKSSSSKGSYVADPQGMTLYIFDEDGAGVSNCYGSCATAWPPYLAVNAPATLPTNLTTVRRNDGTLQYAYKNRPVYYYYNDKKPGDTTGDGVNGTWHLVKP